MNPYCALKCTTLQQFMSMYSGNPIDSDLWTVFKTLDNSDVIWDLMQQLNISCGRGVTRLFQTYWKRPCKVSIVTTNGPAGGAAVLKVIFGKHSFEVDWAG